MFIHGLEAGHWLHVHAAYLPLAQLLRAALGGIPGFDAERILGILSVLSGAAMVGLSADLCARLTGNRTASLTAGALIGLSPVVWLAAGMVEIHVFAGAGSCLAAWLAYVLPGRPAWRSGLATCVAMLTHMTNVMMAPLFLALAFQRDERDRTVREIGSAAAVVVVVVLALKAVGEALPPKIDSLGIAFSILFESLLGRASDPGELARRFAEDYGLAWMLLAPMPLLAVLVRSPGLRFLAAVCCALSISGALVAAGYYLSILGQYGLVLAPALAIGAALTIASPKRKSFRAAIVASCLLGQVALGVPEHKRLSADPSRAWAETVAPHVQEPCIVFCLGLARMMRFEQATGIRPFNFMPVGDIARGSPDAAVVEAVRQAQEQGKRVYLDADIFEEARSSPTLSPVVRSMERVLVIEQVSGAPLYIVRGLRSRSEDP